MKKYFVVASLLIYSSVIFCQEKKGHVEKLDPALDAIINSNAKVEIIAEGFEWCEGPLWVEKEKMLLFSDVPTNIIYKWTEKKGKEIYLTPSGYTSKVPRGGEQGSNGLILSPNNQLIICMDGDRRVAAMNSTLQNPQPVFTTLADNYSGKKFNSPNDMAYNSKGQLYFTDPPYGLEKNMDDPLKELPYQGIFTIKKDGKVILLTDTITRPNGIGITPDQKTLIIANSDPLKPYWYAFDFAGEDKLVNPRIFYDASQAAKTETGMPDGFKIDHKGNVFATGPGGVWIFNKNGKVLGKIKFDGVTSNCSLSADEKTIYITADMYLLRVKMKN
ncbi:MAG: SMP-30/gluconolactonase/LRE family protein [Chitinophagaceae bacterium]